jgi:phosphoribosylanthranilate isomerase
MDISPYLPNVVCQTHVLIIADRATLASLRPYGKLRAVKTQVKICGITNIDDALVAAAAGADYLGFILWPGSKRAVTAQEVQLMATTLRRRPSCPQLVGVFVNETGDVVARLLDELNLDLAQLSGEEPPVLVADPGSPLYGRSYKGIRPTSFAEAEAEAEWYVPPAPATSQPSLLLDAYHPTLRGGTGLQADWAMAAKLAATVDGLMLAGGLNADNVAAAVRQVKPFAVDVASGVEKAPGIKDQELVRKFIRNVGAVRA